MILLNGKVVDITKFPNNEILIRDISNVSDSLNVIDFKFESNEDLINLMFIKKHIDEKSPKATNKLMIPYLPYSRMDRTEGKNIFTLKYICEFINSLKFDKVMTFEAHSNVSLALLDRLENTNYSVELAKKCMEDINFNKEKDYIVFPDDGSKKRYGNEFKDCKLLTCTKHRDFLTGKITSLKINEVIPDIEFKAIIVDDLCSYGGTFVMASNTLKELGAEKIYLCITHSEDGLFLGNIFKENVIDKVYTTDSIFDLDRIIDNPSTTVLPSRINVEKLF
jgi:ribose-phosphate pyrophosphokinase